MLHAKVEEGILHARQVHPGEEDDPSCNRRMHETAVKHVLATAGKAALKARMPPLDALVHAGVRRLKKLL